MGGFYYDAIIIFSTRITDACYSRYRLYKVLKTLGATYKPKAIIIFTAHWESEALTISSSDNEYETIYDFGGFPPELYEIKYRAKGSSNIASMLETKFKTKVFQSIII